MAIVVASISVAAYGSAACGEGCSVNQGCGGTCPRCSWKFTCVPGTPYGCGELCQDDAGCGGTCTRCSKAPLSPYDGVCVNTQTHSCGSVCVVNTDCGANCSVCSPEQPHTRNNPQSQCIAGCNQTCAVREDCHGIDNFGCGNCVRGACVKGKACGAPCMADDECGTYDDRNCDKCILGKCTSKENCGSVCVVNTDCGANCSVCSLANQTCVAGCNQTCAAQEDCHGYENFGCGNCIKTAPYFPYGACGKGKACGARCDGEDDECGTYDDRSCNKCIYFDAFGWQCAVPHQCGAPCESSDQCGASCPTCTSYQGSPFTGNCTFP